MNIYTVLYFAFILHVNLFWKLGECNGTETPACNSNGTETHAYDDPLTCSSKRNGTQNFIYDFIVVGGGSAGAVVAGRLSENKSVNVLLLEAGETPPYQHLVPGLSSTMHGTHVDWQFRIATQANAFLAYPDRQSVLPQGKMLGGTSGLNDMLYVRGNPSDYDHWKSLGNDGWGFEDVLPFFKKAEGTTIPEQLNDTHYHSTSGPVTISYAEYSTSSLNAFLESADSLGYSLKDINGANQTGSARNSFTLRNQGRCGTYTAYLLPSSCLTNFVAFTNALVQKVVLDEHNRATGVEFTFKGFTINAIASKEVILSAGSVGSPKILMFSGIGNKTQLEALNMTSTVDLPGVGANLQDHVSVAGMMFKLNCTNCTFPMQTTKSLDEFISWSLFKDGPMTLCNANEGVVFVNTKYADPNGDKPDCQIQYLTANFSQQVVDLCKRGISKRAVDDYFAPYNSSTTVSMFPINIRTKSVGTVKLQSNDFSAYPIVDPQYLTHEDDVNVLVEGLKKIREIGNTTAFQKLNATFIPSVFPGCESFQLYSDDYWKCFARHLTITGIHLVGTCKMGNDTDPMAVVDSQLQVRNVTGLRVVDASIMPVIPAGNTNAAAIMIGEKAADMIKKKYI